VPEVRVIAADDKQLGVMPTYEALKMAEEAGLDLVEVSPKAAPPVCRIMDFGKFKFEQSKKANQAKKHASVIEVKEIKFRPKTDDHDFDFKVRHIRRFLEEGNKVRLVIAFRGREIVHPETGKAMLDSVVKTLVDVAHVEQMPMMDGRRMMMVISPKPARGGAQRPTGAPAVGPSPMMSLAPQVMHSGVPGLGPPVNRPRPAPAPVAAPAAPPADAAPPAPAAPAAAPSDKPQS
jgi:translation initiation factor IF-3